MIEVTICYPRVERVYRTAKLNSMKPNASERDDKPAHSLGSNQPRWRLWLAQITIFSALFVLLLTLFSALGKIVERFFLTLYVD